MAIKTTHFQNGRSAIPLRFATGHFASINSHTNYYLDMTYTKHRLSEASKAAEELSVAFKTSTVVDSILCLDGMEVVGTCMASELTKAGIRNLNEHHAIYILTPEYRAGGQMIFRENNAHLIRNRHVLVLAASVSTGSTVQKAVNVINYYKGTPVGICCVFTCVDECAGFPVTSLFKSGDLGDYQIYPTNNCPLCQKGERMDAMINSYGLSSF